MPLKDLKKRREYRRNYVWKRYRDDAEYRRKHYQNVKRNKQQARDRASELIADFKRSGCEVCGEPDPVCLDAHHVDSKEKDFDIGRAQGGGFGLKRIASELAKCICVCANCHRKIHAGHVLLPPSGVALARLAHNQEVVGENPTGATRQGKLFGKY